MEDKGYVPFPFDIITLIHEFKDSIKFFKGNRNQINDLIHVRKKDRKKKWNLLIFYPKKNKYLLIKQHLFNTDQIKTIYELFLNGLLKFNQSLPLEKPKINKKKNKERRYK